MGSGSYLIHDFFIKGSLADGDWRTARVSRAPHLDNLFRYEPVMKYRGRKKNLVNELAVGAGLLWRQIRLTGWSRRWLQPESKS